MALVSIDPQHYVQSADLLDAVTIQTIREATAASSSLSAYTSMAGDDAGGEAFAGEYDPLAAAILQAMHAIGVKCTAFDRGVMSAGLSHRQADLKRQRDRRGRHTHRNVGGWRSHRPRTVPGAGLRRRYFQQQHECSCRSPDSGCPAHDRR